MANDYVGVERMESVPDAPSCLLDTLPDEMAFEGQLLRLGAGEFIDRYNYMALAFARRALLQVIPEVAPEVVADLAHNVYPLYLADRATGTESRDWEDNDPRWQQIKPWFPEAVEWVKRWFHLDLYREDGNSRWTVGSAWPLMAASETCRTWEDCGIDTATDDLSCLLLFDNPGFDLMLASDRAKQEMRTERKPIRVRVSEQRWNPWLETRAAAEARIQRVVMASVRARLDQIEAGLERRGQNRTPVKPAAREHLTWVVRYQMKGESFSQIAMSAYRSRSTVAEAVNGILEALMIPPRPMSAPGRPRGSRRLQNPTKRRM